MACSGENRRTGDSSRTTTIRLRDLYDPRPAAPKAPVRIRPPGPRTPSDLNLNQRSTRDPVRVRPPGPRTPSDLNLDQRSTRDPVRVRPLGSRTPSDLSLDQRSTRDPVRVRPPGPRTPSDPVRVSSSDPPTRTIMRRRAQSLPSSSDRTNGLRSLQVRFVDSLGLDLEDVKTFRVQDFPLIPQHVMFRLLMSSELAFGKSLELSLPYFKACFPEDVASEPDFMQRLRSQSVCLERVQCSELGITGTVRVLNLSYEKEVTVHYSFTNWRTHTQTSAWWESGGTLNDVPSDSFRFRLPVPPFLLQPGALLEFAVRYRVQGAERWDNNNDKNYTLTCHNYRVTVPRECEDSMLHFT